ncbi:MAG TPA: long-chain fatty acid--CoA ligase [Planctomycetota bacterium]
MEPVTLGDVYRLSMERNPKPDRYLRKRNGAWEPVSAAALDRDVRGCAAALAALGIGRGDRVAILSYNRYEWAVADWACQLLGVADVPIYSTLPADQVQFILKDAGAKAVFVENAGQAAKVGDLKAIAFDPAPGTTPFAEFIAGKGEPPRVAIAADDLATLIYTSGTTGVPKGVMLTQRNLVSNLTTCCSILDCSAEDVVLSFLPLSHSFERILDYALFWKGAAIAHAEDVDKVVPNLAEIRPTLMGAVPRFYEKIYAKVRESTAKMPGWKRGLFEWARKTGGAEAEYRRRGERAPLGLRLRMSIARWLALGKMAKRLGGRMRLLVSGGGALSRDVNEYLWSLGFTVLEGYGLTETSPVLCINLSKKTKLGTVGPPIPGVEIKIAADGEILARGPNIMKGYLNRPEDTAAVLKDGWFATGDIGELDADGFLRITDRKKDLLKTSNGKYIAPQPIENKLKLSPHVLNAIVIGDRQKFPAALIVAAPGATRERVGEAVEAVNKDLPHHEKIVKFAMLDQDFTIEGGELTPTMKVKRRAVEKKYASVISGLYES